MLSNNTTMMKDDLPRARDLLRNLAFVFVLSGISSSVGAATVSAGINGYVHTPAAAGFGQAVSGTIDSGAPTGSFSNNAFLSNNNADASVLYTIFPRPAVVAHAVTDVQSDDPRYTYANALADLSYTFSIFAPPSASPTAVPVIIRGRIETAVGGYGRSMASLTLFSDDFGARPQERESQIVNTPGLLTQIETDGVITYLAHRESMEIKLDPELHASIRPGYVSTVELFAEAWGYSDPFTKADGFGYAYVDPFIYIDPFWALSNPGYSLVVEAGVGNSLPESPGLVSEPGEIWLILLGLSIGGVASRRRLTPRNWAENSG